MKTLAAFLALLLATATAMASGNMAVHVKRSKITGVDVIAYPTAVKDVVTIVGSLPAGDAFAGQGNAAVPTLTGMMLDRGTTKEDKFAIAQQLESVGASISFGVDNQTLSIHARSLKKDLPLVIGLIAEQLRTPAFASAEFERARQQFIGGLKASVENVDFRADEAFGRAVFPPGHPNREHSLDEYLAAAQSAKLDEVKAFHQRYYGPAHMTLVVVGDVDVSQLQVAVKRGFSGWTGGADVMRSAKAAAPTGARDELVSLKDKPSVSMLLGQPTGLRYSDPDALALRVGTAIFGSGFTGRLMSTVRDKEGLTYGIGAGLSGDTFGDGSWRITASFAPQLLDQGVASTRRELQKWWAEGVTAQELTTRKENLVGTFQVGLSTTSGLAAALLAAVQRGYDVSWLDEYPKAINALTLEQVNGAIKEHLDPTRMVLVKAGSLQ